MVQKSVFDSLGHEGNKLSETQNAHCNQRWELCINHQINEDIHKTDSTARNAITNYELNPAITNMHNKMSGHQCFSFDASNEKTKLHYPIPPQAWSLPQHICGYNNLKRLCCTDFAHTIRASGTICLCLLMADSSTP